MRGADSRRHCLPAYADADRRAAQQRAVAELAQLAPGQPVRVLARGRLYIGEVADLPAERTAHSFPIMVSREPGYAEHFKCTAHELLEGWR